MGLVDTRDMLLKAQEEKYAIGAFNIENMEMAQAVIETAEEMESPVICAVSQNAMKYARADLYCAIVAAIAKHVKVPVAIHVDHAETEETALKALCGNFTSVMIDGSKLTYRENRNLTKRVVDICNIFSIPVEGEIGPIGGKTDAVPDYKLIYTDPQAAKDFVEETGVSSLAVAIGTAHGIYKNTPRLDIDRLSEIMEVVKVPLVLHGASGVPDDQICECINRGICKINYATELRIAFSNAVRCFLREDDKTFDPKVYSKFGRDAVKNVVRQKIEILGSAGKCV